MGLDLCWIGVEARHRKRLLGWFDLEPAGEAADELGADFTLAATPEGWIVLAARAHGFGLDEALTGVSSSCGFAVGGEIIEGATYSRACAARGGTRLWSVSYNDGGSNELDAGGDVPAELEGIKARLTAQEASASDAVSYLLEAPADLTAAITGYRPGEDPGLEWTVLQKRPSKDRAAPRRPRSLRAAMFSELVPRLRSVGWECAEQPVLADMWEIRRTLEGVEQTIWFDYASGQETYVIVHFLAKSSPGGEEFMLGGRVMAPRTRLPVWKRFSWKRLRELARPEPRAVDLIGAAVERADDDIRIADAYLRSWSPTPRILIDFARPRPPAPRSAATD